MSARVEAVASKALGGERISADEALVLLERADLVTLGALADLARRRLHPDRVVTYIIDRNVNYTNVCNAFCTFCAFYRPPHHDEGYVLSFETIEKKVQETYELGGNQILLQGGHNPKLKIDYYETLFQAYSENLHTAQVLLTARDLDDRQTYLTCGTPCARFLR